MNKKIVYIIVVFFAFILLSSTIVTLIPKASAQQPTQQIIQRLENEGKNNCEVWQINEFFYKPIRINLVHEPVSNHGVKVKSTDPASEVFWEGSKQTFQLVTDSTDRHTVEIVLDYEVRHENPRQVFYQVYAMDNTLMMEGNWVHEGFTFCKVIEFWAVAPPHILTAEEIQQENNKFNADFRKETASSNTSLQNAMIVVAIVVLVIGTITGLIFFIIIVSLKSMGRIQKKPIKKLEEMISLVRVVSDNLKLVSDHLLKTDQNAKRDLIAKVNNSLADLSIVISGLQRQVEEKIIPIPAPEEIESQNCIIERKEPPKTSSAIDDSPNTPEQEKINEDSMAELYGVSGNMKPTEITFANIDLEEKDDAIMESIKVEGLEVALDDEIIEELQKGDDENEEEKIIELNKNEVKPCKTCGEEPQVICGQCNNFYCNEHQNHDCEKEKKIKEKEVTISTLTKKTKNIFFDDKKPTIMDDGQIQKMLDEGIDEQSITNQLCDEYFKTPRNDNLRIYADLQEKEKKARTRELDIKLNAMLITLNRQVNK